MSCERTGITWPLVATDSELATFLSSISAISLRFEFGFSALVANTRFTTPASLLEVSSKMMIDFEVPMLLRFSSPSELRSAVLVTTSRPFRAPALFLICCSIHSRVLLEKITTVGLRRRFFPASSNSLRIGKIRLDHPRMRVWLLAIIGERPFLISVIAALIAVTMKPVTVPPEAAPRSQ